MHPIYLLLSAVTILVATALFFDRWERAQWSPTHKGWFAFLPVYIRDPEGECEIDGRFGMGFLVPVAAWIQNTAGAMRELFDPSLDPFEQPGFVIKLTGRVTPLRPFWGSGKALILFALVMLPFLSVGCGSMPADRITYNTIDGAVNGVHAGLRSFNEFYQAGKATEEQRDQVLAAYKKFQAVARAAVRIAPNATSASPDTIRLVSDAAVELLRLIEAFRSTKTSELQPREPELRELPPPLWAWQPGIGGAW